MQRHVDIYRHKVIMGLHNKQRGKMLTDGGISLPQDDMKSMIDEEVELMQEIAMDDPN